MQGNGTEWIDEGFPTPNYLYHANRGYDVAWQIEGFFATQKGIEYLNDIIGRISITLSDCKPQRLPWKPDIKQKLAHYYPKIHKLLAFKSLKSLSNKLHAPTRADALGGDDYCFWAIKLYTEDLIRQLGEGTPIPNHMVEDWAYIQFDDYKKGKSTVRAKCRSVWNWYDTQGWELPKIYVKKYNTPQEIKELSMTRQERAKVNSKLIQEKAKRKVINTITGMFADEYKKVNGTWHISKISKQLAMSRNTVSKYLKQWEEEAEKVHRG
jgi:predicted transcriptional regulator